MALARLSTPGSKEIFLWYTGPHEREYAETIFGAVRGNGGWRLAFAGAGVVAFLGDQTKALEKTFWFVALACGALATLIVLWNLIDALGNGGASVLSIGIYIAAIGAVGVLLAAYLFRSPGDSIKGGFDSMKHDIEDKVK